MWKVLDVFVYLRKGDFLMETIFYNIKIKYSAAELCLLHLKTSRNRKRMSNYLCFAQVYIFVQIFAETSISTF